MDANRTDQIADEVEQLAEEVTSTLPWTAPYAAERAAYARAVLDEQAIRDSLVEVGHLTARTASAQRCRRWNASQTEPHGVGMRSDCRR